MMILLKYILKQKQMNEVYTGGIGSFALFLLIVSFLQQHDESRLEPPIDELLIDFCELYGSEFNYISTGICVNDGGSYFSKDRRGWLNEDQPHLLSIQDPSEEDNVRITNRST